MQQYFKTRAIECHLSVYRGMLNLKSPSLLNKWTCHRLVFTERKENMGFVEFNFLIFESSRTATPFMTILNRLRVCL